MYKTKIYNDATTATSTANTTVIGSRRRRCDAAVAVLVDAFAGSALVYLLAAASDGSNDNSDAGRVLSCCLRLNSFSSSFAPSIVVSVLVSVFCYFVLCLVYIFLLFVCCLSIFLNSILVAGSAADADASASFESPPQLQLSNFLLSACVCVCVFEICVCVCVSLIIIQDFQLG